jgi:hypothetical protein
MNDINPDIIVYLYHNYTWDLLRDRRAYYLCNFLDCTDYHDEFLLIGESLEFDNSHEDYPTGVYNTRRQWIEQQYKELKMAKYFSVSIGLFDAKPYGTDGEVIDADGCVHNNVYPISKYPSWLIGDDPYLNELFEDRLLSNGGSVSEATMELLRYTGVIAE